MLRGAQLPPHLSPFAGDGPDGEDHVPDYQLELQRLQARAARPPFPPAFVCMHSAVVLRARTKFPTTYTCAWNQSPSIID